MGPLEHGPKMRMPPDSGRASSGKAFLFGGTVTSKNDENGSYSFGPGTLNFEDRYFLQPFPPFGPPLRDGTGLDDARSDKQTSWGGNLESDSSRTLPINR